MALIIVIGPLVSAMPQTAVMIQMVISLQTYVLTHKYLFTLIRTLLMPKIYGFGKTHQSHTGGAHKLFNCNIFKDNLKSNICGVFIWREHQNDKNKSVTIKITKTLLSSSI